MDLGGTSKSSDTVTDESSSTHRGWITLVVSPSGANVHMSCSTAKTIHWRRPHVHVQRLLKGLSLIRLPTC